MRITVSTMNKLIIIFLIILSLSLLKPFGIANEPWAGDTTIQLICAMSSMLLCLIILLKYWSLNKFLNIECLIILGATIVAICTTVKEGKTFSNAIACSFVYWYVFLAIPLLYLLERGKWKLEKMFKIIMILTTVSYLLRLLISLLERFTGNLVLESIALESAAENWYRNGWLRINPPCFGNIIIPIAFYMYCKTQKMKDKLKYILAIGISLIYTVLIHRSRAVLLYQIVIIVFLVLLKNKNKTKQFLLKIFLLVCTVVAINLPQVNSFFDSFSKSSTNVDSVSGRLETIPYWFYQFTSNPNGVGFLSYKEREFTGDVGWVLSTLEDLGILYSVVQLGVLALVFYLVFFARGIWVGKRTRALYGDMELDILVWGITFSVLLTCINIDLFYPIYAFSAPFCLAIIEYINYMCNRRKLSET